MSELIGLIWSRYHSINTFFLNGNHQKFLELQARIWEERRIKIQTLALDFDERNKLDVEFNQVFIYSECDTGEMTYMKGIFELSAFLILKFQSF